MNVQPQGHSRRWKFGLHLKRTRVQFIPSTKGGATSEAGGEGRLVLNEVTTRGITIFSAAAGQVGQEVNLTIEHPTRFLTKARIISCSECPVTFSIVRSNAYRFRIGIEFLVSDEEAAKELKNYYDRVQHEVGRLAPGGPARSKPAAHAAAPAEEAAAGGADEAAAALGSVGDAVADEAAATEDKAA